ncbi:2OG-Fe(II) oxygenase family protein [Streptomyces polyrhachis]|uniref:2OG-Fe(II) oxygenase family protein n=1 Tax=Streptomyces polyrhachis TaxID=1282885 RepID=A0ABW2GLY1_9ACTN
MRRLMRSRTFEERQSVVNPELDGLASRCRGAMLRHSATAQTLGDDSDNALPRAYKSILDELHQHDDMFGVPGRDWSIVGFSFWKYPAGSRLGWHNDVAPGRRGEFILFLHEQWKASWAGELLLLDADPETINCDVSKMSPLEAVEERVGVASTCLTAIVPKPNRLVFVEEGTIHSIQRVDQSAGSAVRETMTGFVAASRRRESAKDDGKLERLVSMFYAR